MRYLYFFLFCKKNPEYSHDRLIDVRTIFTDWRSRSPEDLRLDMFTFVADGRFKILKVVKVL